jgi:hypothetical protein
MVCRYPGSGLAKAPVDGIVRAGPGNRAEPPVNVPYRTSSWCYGNRRSAWPLSLRSSAITPRNFPVG